MIVDERFQRTAMMLGKKKMTKLTQAHITIVGLGAVGSHALEALVRMGVGHLRLIDSESVKTSNINRQLIATEASLGQKKIIAAQTRAQLINPACQVEVIDGFVAADTVEELMRQPTDGVVDAIDSLNPKVNLIKYLVEKKIPFISSMGASRRFDPFAIQVGELSKVHGCRLASKVRSQLRRMGYEKGVQCVYSTEVISKQTIGDQPESFFRGRTRLPNGSLCIIPGIFGYIAASEMIKHLLH